MTVRTKVILAALWAISLMVTARLTGNAQTAPQMGQEVRFMKSQGTGAGHRGILVANFGGQWLPVELDRMPDGNSLDGPTPAR